MKKFLAMMLAVLMLLSMATVAMAEDLGTPSNQNGDGWNKGYFAPGASFDLKLAYENASSAPTETFNFKIDSVSNAPEITTYTETVTNTTGTGLANDGKISVTLPNYTAPGTYTYKIKQTIPEEDKKTKGVTYDGAERTMIVYVENNLVNGENKGLKCQVAVKNGDNKSDTFTNAYNQGTAMITKRVDSTVAADKAKDYNFTITLADVNDVNYTGVVVDANGEPVADVANVTIHGTSETTFTLKDGQSLKIEHLPNGASYTVTETKPSVDASHNGTVTVKYDNVEAVYNENGVSTNAATGEIKTDETATSTIANNFAYKGDLVVKKVVTGNLGDEGKWFTFTVTGITNNTDIAKNDKVRNDSFTQDGNYTFEMQHNGQITFKDLPYGTSYTVTELSDGYNSSKIVKQYFVGDTEDSNAKEEDGKMDHAKEVVTFTNKNEQEIPTGVSLDTLPYVLVLALAGAGLVLMIARKRRVQD